MRVVKFKNGKFGVRRGIPLFYSYLDMDSGNYWWWSGTYLEKWAQTESELIARAWMNKLRKERWPDWGTPV